MLKKKGKPEVKEKKPRGLKHGILLKCSNRIKRWKETWVVLRYTELLIFDTQCVKHSAFPLKGCSVVEADVEDTKRGFTFKITTHNSQKSVLVSAADRDALESWMAAIRAVSGLHSPLDTRSNKISQEQQSLRSELATIVSLADKMIPAVACDMILTFEPTAFDKAPLILAEELGSTATSLANVVNIVVLKRTPQSVKQLCAQLVQLATTVVELQRLYVGSGTGAIFEELRGTAASVFNTCTDLVFQFGSEGTYQEQLQAASLIVIKCIPAVSEAAMAIKIEDLTSSMSKLGNNVKMITDLALKVSAKTGHDLPLFAAPILPVLCDDFQLTANRIVTADDPTSSPLREILDNQAKKLSDGISKVLALCKAADTHTVAIQTLADKMRQSEDLLEDVEHVVLAEASEIPPALRLVLTELDTIPMAIRALDVIQFASSGVKLSSAIQQVIKACASLKNLEISDEVREMFQKNIDSLVSVGHSLFTVVESVVSEQFKNVAQVLRLCGTVNTLAESVTALLRELLRIHKSFKRRATLFDPPPLPDIMECPIVAPCVESESATLATNEAASQEFANPEDVLPEDTDINIWNEPPDNPGNIVDDKEIGVKCANLNKLVERLTKGDKHDITFQKTFITTYRSFTTPEMLFKKLLQRYRLHIPRLPPSVTLEEYHKHTVLPIQLRVVNVLRHWLETSFFDFTDSLASSARKFIEVELISDGHTALSKQLLSILDKQLKEREEGREQARLQSAYLRQPLDAPMDNINDWRHSLSQPAQGESEEMGNISALLAFPLEEIAAQMTFMDFQFYQSIQPVELLNQSWSKKELKHRAPNVLSLSSRFNGLSNWAACVILQPAIVEERVQAWTKLVNLIEALIRLNNFNTSLAVLSGLNSSPIHRLKQTKAMLPPHIQQAQEAKIKLMNPESSHRNYREALHHTNPPCLPYLGVYLTDLTFIEDGNKDFLDGLINFRKRQLVYNIISEIQLYQQKPYDIKPKIDVLRHLQVFPCIKEGDLWELSLKREPKTSS